MLDYFFISYLIWCFVKGITKGLGKELEGFIFALLILGALFGLFAISQLTGLVKMSLQVAMSDSGVLISLTSFIIAVMIFFSLRKKISAFTNSRLSDEISRKGGALVGTLRGSVVLSIVVIILNNVPFELFKGTIHNSIVASQIESWVSINEPVPVTAKVPSDTPEELIIGY